MNVRLYPVARVPADRTTLRWPLAGECTTCGTQFARFVPNVPWQATEILPTVFSSIECSMAPIPGLRAKHCRCGVVLLEDPWRKLIGNEA